MELQGAYTALVTPFSPDGAAVDLERLDQLIRHQAEGGVRGIVPCGTTGETPTLSEDEQRLVIRRAVDVGHALGLQVIAGAGANDTRHAVERQRRAQELGADATLQVVPYYNRPSQAGLERHFRAIADASDIPIVLYNVPSRTGTRLAIDTIIRLAEHPRIAAIKDATGSLDMASATVARTDLALLCGDDSLTLPMASVGGVGVISVLSNLVPRRVAKLCDAIARDDWRAARLMHLELFDLATGLLQLDTNPVPIKTALAAMGLDTGVVRSPLAGASEPVRSAIDTLLARVTGPGGWIEPKTEAPVSIG